VRRTHADTAQALDVKSTVQPAVKSTDKDPGREPADSRALVEALQHSAGNAAVGALLADSRRAAFAGTGQELAPAIRESAERKVGSDLTGVRVHSDAAANAFVRSMHAQAATVDRDVFVSDSVDDSTARGRKTLLHELVHVAQSGSASALPERSETNTSSTMRIEDEAARIAAGSAAGASGLTERAQPGVAHLKAADDDEAVPEPDGQATAGPTAEELLNPPESTEDETPAPGTSGEAEGVAYEVTIMQPLRAAQLAVDDQDWEKAYAILQTIGMRMMNYQNAYEKSDPLLYRSLMSARGWIGVFYQQLERRLDKDTWSDQRMSEFFKSDVIEEFQAIEDKLH